MDIFISHSSKDADIALALIKLLRAALNLPSEAIRCTSVDGYRLPTGASVEDQLRQEIHEAKILIGLITNASLKSHYVLFELGARWGANNFLAPLLAGGVNASGLPGPLKGRNAINCNNPGEVQQLVDDIAQKLGCSTERPASFLINIEELIGLSKAKSSNVTYDDTGNSGKTDNSTELSNQSGPKLEIKTEFHPIRSYDELVQYDLNITLSNIGNIVVADYRVEIEIPNAFLNQATNYHAEVKDRRTPTHRFFRHTNKHFNDRVLYPGDSLMIFAIDYSVDENIARSESMKDTLQIRAYAGNDRVDQKVLQMSEAAKFFGR
jgi:hypothetical protein